MTAFCVLLPKICASNGHSAIDPHSEKRLSHSSSIIRIKNRTVWFGYSLRNLTWRFWYLVSFSFYFQTTLVSAESEKSMIFIVFFWYYTHSTSLEVYDSEKKNRCCKTFLQECLSQNPIKNVTAKFNLCLKFRD